MNEPSPERPNPYDEIPYTSFAYPRTHPDHLHTMAALFGLSPAPVDGCRVLELGCASAGNLIPMAEQLPGSTFVGIDLSRRQIEIGRTGLEAAGVDNVHLHQADLTALDDLDEDLGTFDYVVCHGVFSWVAPDVQDAILDLCRARLNPQGVGFISYNTYPGWRMREAVRDMMLYHVQQFDDARTRVEQARALVEFLAGAVSDDDDPHRLLLRRELRILQRTGSDYLFHEHLEEHNRPCYFHEFATRLQGAGLQYLGEADAPTMLNRDLPDEVVETLSRISPDIVRLEQYTDFIRNRQMRQTLVCHADLELERSLPPRRVFDRYLGFSGRPEPGPVDLSAGARVRFELAPDSSVASSRPATKAALVVLGRVAPAVLPFDELWTRTRALLAEASLLVVDEDNDRSELAADLLECFFRGGIELRSWAPRFATELGARPRVGDYARWQASHAEFVTSRRHARIDLDEAAARIVQLLDGTRDREALVAALTELVRDGTLALSRDDQRIDDDAAMTEALGLVVDESLRILLQHAVLLDGSDAG